MDTQVTERFNPEMLKLARQLRQLVQKELAEATGISQGTISKIELGIEEPSPSTVSIFANALRFPGDFFLQGGVLYPPAAPLQRRRSQLRKRDLDFAEAMGNFRRLILSRLLSSVEIDVGIPEFDAESFDGNMESIASQVRAIFRLPMGPIANLVQVLEDAGAFVSFFDFGSVYLDGFTLVGDGIHPLILGNSSSPMDRLRFTLAHELAHLVLHRRSRSVDFEREANEFAACFLMPEREIRTHLVRLTLERLADLKRYWKASMNSLLRRAVSLRTVTPSQAKYLWIQMGKRGLRTKEPVEIPRETPTLEHEILDFYRKELRYSDEDLLRLLRIGKTDLEELYDEQRRRLRLIK